MRMIIMSATAFRRDLYNMLEQAVRYNEPITVTTKYGNAIVISEEEFNSIKETLLLSSIPCMRKEVLEGINTPFEECVSANELDW